MVMSPEKIKERITGAFSCEELYVQGDGEHFEAIVVSVVFEGKSRVQRQQMVNRALRPLFDSGELHALSMKTVTPAEWSARHG